MFFAGFSWPVVLGLAASAGALVVALYFLRLRLRPVTVPFAALWENLLAERSRTTLFSRFKRLLSLLLHLLIVALLALALGDPRRQEANEAARSIAVLVDSSASMKAQDESPNRLEAAKRLLRKQIASLSPRDRMQICSLDALATPLSTMTRDVAELSDAVGQLHAVDTGIDLAAGFELALDVLEGQPQPTVLLISDGAIDPDEVAGLGERMKSVRLEFLSVGRPGDNLALTNLAVRRYPLDATRYEAMLELYNGSDRRREVEVIVRGDGRVVDVRRLAIESQERVERFYGDLGGAIRDVVAEVRPVDGQPELFTADDRAFALLPGRTRTRVLVVSEGNTYLEAALLLDDFLQVEWITPAEFPLAEDFDVTIFDRFAPAEAPTSPALYIDPPAGSGPVARGGTMEMFGFDRWLEDSPLLRWIAPGDIQVLDGRALLPGPDDRVVGASVQGALLLEGARAGSKFVALAFDPRRSDFVLRVAWPIFVLNTIQALLDASDDYASSVATGQAWTLDVPPAAESAVWVTPDGSRRVVPAREGRLVVWGEQAGMHEIVVAGASDKQRFAANLASANESELAANPELKLFGRVAEPPRSEPAGILAAAAFGSIWVYLLVSVLLLSLLEWWSYHRRWTV